MALSSAVRTLAIASGIGLAGLLTAREDFCGRHGAAGLLERAIAVAALIRCRLLARYLGKDGKQGWAFLDALRN